MSDRFFVDRPVEGTAAALSGSEARHLTKVMRAKVGDMVTLFDGTGVEYPARIACIGRERVELEVLAHRAVDRELALDLVLAVALPKGDRQRWLVEKAVELGVRRLVPLVTERAVAQPVERALGRLRRTVVEASKQCGRNRLMEIAAPEPFVRFAQAVSEDALCVVAHPNPDAIPAARVLEQTQDAPHIVLAVGPEGGFTEDELAAARRRWRVVHLGRRTLRVETAAVALVAMFSLGRRA